MIGYSLWVADEELSEVRWKKHPRSLEKGTSPSKFGVYGEAHPRQDIYLGAWIETLPGGIRDLARRYRRVRAEYFRDGPRNHFGTRDRWGRLGGGLGALPPRCARSTNPRLRAKTYTTLAGAANVRGRRAATGRAGDVVRDSVEVFHKFVLRRRFHGNVATVRF